MKKSSFLAVLGFVVVVSLPVSSATAGQRDIPVPDAGFDDHALNSIGDYIYIGDSGYMGAWKSHYGSGGAYIDYRYWMADGDLPARSGDLKAYPSDAEVFDYIYQILDQTYVEGETYTLSVWVGNAWPAEGYAEVPAFRRLIEISPDNGDIRASFGLFLHRSGRSIAGQAVLEGASSRFPGNGMVWLNLAEVLHDQGNTEKAIEAKDLRAFTAGYDKLTAACNACHQGTDNGFIVIKRPTQPAFTNQDYRPRN